MNPEKPEESLSIGEFTIRTNEHLENGQIAFITQPPVRAEAMGLFPTLTSLQQVIDMANSQLPITTPNQMFSLLMVYHNSLLYQVECCKAKE
jgi:hypothetical protein